MKKINIRGKEAIVDDDDYEAISKYTWGIARGGYAIRNRRVNGRQQGSLMHREILRLAKGDGVEVDHINGNPLDNRKQNLRICSRSQNMGNTKKTTRNTSGYKGVSYDTKSRKFKAQINFNGRNRHLGLYLCAEEAHEVYALAADMLFGEFSRHM